MNISQKALLMRDLQKASASLTNAYRFVKAEDPSNATLIGRLRHESKTIGALIVEVGGGPVVSLQDMV